MLPPGLRVTLYLGYSPEPAPAWLIEAIDQIEVTRTDSVPYGFQLTFLAERAATSAADYPVLASDLLAVGTRIVVAVSVFGTPSVVADGFITNQQLMPGTMSEDARLVVTGEDVSVRMALYEYSLEYPYAPDMAIAELVLAKWMFLGILPDVHPTPTSMVTFTNVPQQVGNDRAYLVRLAAQHGYVFFIRPGPSIGSNTAYWGPPPRGNTPQPALTVDAGAGSTVEDIKFNYDALAPRLIYGLVDDAYLGMTVPVVTVGSTRTPALATNPALDNFPFARTTLFKHEGLGTILSYAKAQALTNRSTDEVVTAEGSLDVLRYGSVLDAPGVVPVRGVGASYDGLYYVKQASHQISRTGYRQSFKLTREGLGSTITSVAS
jgi:hypothetical protein